MKPIPNAHKPPFGSILLGAKVQKVSWKSKLNFTCEFKAITSTFSKGEEELEADYLHLV